LKKEVTEMAKHTPGPWFLSPQRKFVRYKNGDMGSANICEMGQGAPLDEDEANAVLIAAAPDLLIALDELASAVADARGRYEAGDSRAIESNMLTATYRQAIAVLAHAEAK
jgi:hypothetical protein